MSTAVDPGALLRALGIANPTAIVPIPGGFGDSAIWRVQSGTDPGHAFALRVFAADDERTMWRERAAMRCAQRQGVAAPSIHRSEIIEGRPVMLLDWCPGRTMLENLLTHPHRAWALGTILGTAHGKLHRRRPDQELRERGTDWIGWAGPAESAMQDRIRLVSERDALPPAILHLDFHPANVLVHAGRVTGVIDWANASVGDPRADVARTAAILCFAPIPPGAPRAQIQRLRRTFRRGWRLAHRRVMGYLPEMDLFDAWALAMMLRDLSSKVDHANTGAMGFSEADLFPVRAALARRKARLGLG